MVNLETVLDHSQTIRILDTDELDDFEKEIYKFTWFGKKLTKGMTDYFQNEIDFYKEYGKYGFKLGYYSYNNVENDSVIVVGMYNNGMGYQRVMWENAKCNKCGAVWFIANPTGYDLYPKGDFDIKDLKYPLLNCQKCGGMLSRSAIWMKLSQKHNY